MEDFFQQLPSNPWAWLFLAIITIGGFILAYRSTPQKVLKYYIVNNELISNSKKKYSKLNITYKGENIKNLTVTKVVFWNNAYPTINSTDIAEPISVIALDGKILDINILAGHHSSNNISISISSDYKATISFDYLDRKEGGVIQLVHTGNVLYGMILSGKIKSGKIKFSDSNLVSGQYIATMMFIGQMIASITYLSLILKNPESFLPSSWYAIQEIYRLKTPYAILVILISVGIFLIIWWLLHKFFNKEIKFIPKNCKFK